MLLGMGAAGIGGAATRGTTAMRLRLRAIMVSGDLLLGRMFFTLGEIGNSACGA